MNTPAKKQQSATLLRLATLKTREGLTRRDGIVLDPSVLEIPAGFNVRGVGLDQDEYLAQPHIQDYIERLAYSYTVDAKRVPPMLVSLNAETGGAQVIDGYHRYLGLMLAIKNGAKIEKLSVIELVGGEVSKHISMLNLGDSLKLTAVEFGEIYHRLITKHFLTPQEIADQSGKSLTHISRMLAVHELPLDVKRQIQLGKMTVASALSSKEQKSVNDYTRKYRNAVKGLAASIMDINPQNVVVKDGIATIQISAEAWNSFLESKAEQDEMLALVEQEKKFKELQCDLLSAS